MSSILNLTDLTQKVDGIALDPAVVATIGRKVRNRGLIAVVLMFVGLIPIIGVLFLIASLLLALHALKLSRENLVPVEYERCAYWARIGSSLVLILNVIRFTLAVMT